MLDVRGHHDARREVGKADQADPVVLADALVVGRIAEGQREQALLLQVRLVDPREATGDDRGPAEQPWRQRGVFAAAALAIVSVADRHQLTPARPAVPRDVGERAGLTVVHVGSSLAGVAREGVVRPDEHVSLNCLEMAAEAQPRAGRRDVVGGTSCLWL